MGKRRGGLTYAALKVARAAAQQQDERAAQVSQRVYNAIVEAKASGESGDVSPLLWGPLAVAAEMMASVVVRANELGERDEELHVDVAAYFVAGFIAGGHGFDAEHFGDWRRRADAGVAPEVEPG